MVQLADITVEPPTGARHSNPQKISKIDTMFSLTVHDHARPSVLFYFFKLSSLPLNPFPPFFSVLKR